MNSIKGLLQEFDKAMVDAGAVSPKTIKILEETGQIDQLNEIDGVDITDELIEYLQAVSGYDLDKEIELDSSDAAYLWGQSIIPVENISEKYQARDWVIDEEPDFWPEGFLPILQSNNSDYVMINCREGSPTRGAVYEYIDCEGTLFIANSISDFIKGCTDVVLSKTVVFDDPEIWEFTEFPEYWSAVSKAFGFRARQPGEADHPRAVKNW